MTVKFEHSAVINRTTERHNTEPPHHSSNHPLAGMSQFYCFRDNFDWPFTSDLPLEVTFVQNIKFEVETIANKAALNNWSSPWSSFKLQNVSMRGKMTDFQLATNDTISVCEFLTILVTIVIGVAISGSILLIMIQVIVTVLLVHDLIGLYR